MFWEHAYYPSTGANARPKYVEAFWKLANWDSSPRHERLSSRKTAQSQDESWQYLRDLKETKTMTGYVCRSNTDHGEHVFSTVLFTGPHSQLVVMCLRPGEDSGDEVLPHCRPVLPHRKGQAKFVLNEKEEHTVRDGDAGGGSGGDVP